MELGLATFADLSSGISPEQRMRDLLEEAVLADQLGLDVFAIGEHHRPDFLISSPAVALAAMAAKTRADPTCRAPSPCSAPTTRCGSFSSSPSST